MTRDEAKATIDAIAACRGDDTIPSEDVIDLAQAVQFLFNVLDARQMLDNVPWKGMNQP